MTRLPNALWGGEPVVPEGTAVFVAPITPECQECVKRLAPGGPVVNLSQRVHLRAKNPLKSILVSSPGLIVRGFAPLSRTSPNRREVLAEEEAAVAVIEVWFPERSSRRFCLTLVGGSPRADFRLWRAKRLRVVTRTGRSAERGLPRNVHVPREGLSGLLDLIRDVGSSLQGGAP